MVMRDQLLMILELRTEHRRKPPAPPLFVLARKIPPLTITPRLWYSSETGAVRSKAIRPLTVKDSIVRETIVMLR